MKPIRLVIQASAKGNTWAVVAYEGEGDKQTRTGFRAEEGKPFYNRATAIEEAETIAARLRKLGREVVLET